MKNSPEKRRITSTEINTGEPILLTRTHKDWPFLRPGQAIEVGSANLTIKGYSISGFSRSGEGLSDEEKKKDDDKKADQDGEIGKAKPLPPGFSSDVLHKWGPKSLAYPIVLPDTPDLSDIESITSSKYYDANNLVKVKLVVKIRNTGKDKSRIVGVDARIFNVGA